ncbi:MAG: hypothetical protein ABSF69_16540 [Polyangiaceae bacterium]|jgi:hypothetical protein
MALLLRSTRQTITYAILAGLAPFMAGGCGSSSSKQESPGTDAGSDALAFTVHPDGSTSSASSSSAASSSNSSKMAYDGTTGALCQSDLDCQPANGPGLNTCSNSLSVLAVVVYPTPVCIGKCTFVDDQMIHFCDGETTSTTTPPGVCIPLGAVTPGSTVAGACLPWCSFTAGGGSPLNSNGAAPACQTNDTCAPFVFFPADTVDTDAGAEALPPLGIGYCFGGCTEDSQCPAGNSCQTNEGFCVATVSPTLATGAACTNPPANAPEQCDCSFNEQGTAGVCTQFCITGSTTATCPAGYVCDATEPTALAIDLDGGMGPGFTTQNPGLVGSCFAACSADSGTCPPNSTCTTGDAVGSDCQPSSQP